jgi:hypothetical protein
MPEYFLDQAGLTSAKDFNGPPGFSGSHDKTIDPVTAGTYEAGALNLQVWKTRLAAGTIDLAKVGEVLTTPTYRDYHWIAGPRTDERFGAGFTDKIKLRCSPSTSTTPSRPSCWPSTGPRSSSPPMWPIHPDRVDRPQARAHPLMAGPVVVSLRGVRVVYDGHPALDGFDLDVHAGERVALVGPSGAGKTTALRLRTAGVTAIAGRVGVLGHDLATSSPAQLGAVRRRARSGRGGHGSARRGARRRQPDAAGQPARLPKLAIDG